MFGSLLTWIGFLAIVFALYLCVNNIKKNLEDGASYFDIGLGLLPRVLFLLFAINIAMITNSNAPKVVLQTDYSEEQAVTKKLQNKHLEVNTINNFAPETKTAEETSKELEDLREKQKTRISLD